MLAFHNDEAIKQKYIDRLKKHYDADEFIKGQYWENGKGCAVGCTIHGSDHKQYESEMGIPEWLAQVEDKLFEGLESSKAKEWPIKFLQSIKVGSDLEKVKIPFIIFVVESTLDKFDHDKFPKVKESIEKVIALLKTNNLTGADAAAAATDANAAYSAAYAAYADAAYSADAAAYSADAAASAAYAAYAAATDDAADATAAAAYSAYAAAYAVSLADDAVSADADAKYKTYQKFADKLIELIEEI